MPNENGKTQRVGRPAKTLLERVLENTFRPKRYGLLLATEMLPARAPYRDRRRRELWRALRRLRYRYKTDPTVRLRVALEFGLVRTLDDGHVPRWYTGEEPYQRRLDRTLRTMRNPPALSDPPRSREPGK